MMWYLNRFFKPQSTQSTAQSSTEENLNFFCVPLWNPRCCLLCSKKEIIYKLRCNNNDAIAKSFF